MEVSADHRAVVGRDIEVTDVRHVGGVAQFGGPEADSPNRISTLALQPALRRLKRQRFYRLLVASYLECLVGIQLKLRPVQYFVSAPTDLGVMAVHSITNGPPNTGSNCGART